MNLPRRDVLAAGGLLTGLLVAGGPLSLIAPGRAWAVELAALDSAEGAILLAVARTIAPHDGLEDVAYAVVTKAVDTAMAADEHVRRLVKSGLAGLGADFAGRSEAARVAALRAIEHSEFFQLARAKTLGTLYSTDIAWAHFGYEGEAFSRGGYLLRGFNDLKWLPEVPLEAAGPAPR